ncbi:hypothetical protein BVG16_21345 [Paenibacillus selenitireducens]|uniref:HTH araC/xylS-type domain-containing protein n=1 Tax=Paenibacillus selenitireducens TaxID=1324314 RepID=A0A1T2X642_9BACL|nr:AraC family transcriptional regulator [Paenibacillus selenitireducens]OPA75156.1 hypothetical protein BVG16_21345 [Paenibacillus selenitireducens]
MKMPSMHQIYNDYFKALSVSRCEEEHKERMQLAPSQGVGYADRLITTSGIEIVESEYRFAGNRTIRVQSEASMVELSFCLQGVGEVQVSDCSHELLVDSCSLQFMRDFQAEFHYLDTEPIRLLSIGIPVPLFESWMAGAGVSGSCSFAGLVGSREFRMFRTPILSETLKLLRQLRNCPYHSTMRKLYAEGKALEVLTAYFDVFLFDQDYTRRSSVLTRSDRDSIWKARDIMLQRMADPPSLIELARLAGINDYKLKMGFKEVFGTSVFAYLRNKRLEKAWEMLHSGSYNVSQTSMMLGYNNFSHFAEVFRKQYGINPSELRRTF